MAAMGTKSNSKAGVSQAVDVANWHFADKRPQPSNGRYWGNNGQRAARTLNKYAAIDPERTLAVHCGKGFDARFSLYQNTRLSR
jgi:hypothetical protein